MSARPALWGEGLGNDPSYPAKDCESDRSSEAIPAVRADPVQAAAFQVVDGGFHCRMLPPRRDEFGARLALPRFLRKSAIRRQCVAIQQRVQPHPVGRAVEAPVEAAAPHRRSGRPVCEDAVDVRMHIRNLVQTRQMTRALDDRVAREPCVRPGIEVFPKLPRENSSVRRDASHGMRH